MLHPGWEGQEDFTRIIISPTEGGDKKPVERSFQRATFHGAVERAIDILMTCEEGTTIIIRRRGIEWVFEYGYELRSRPAHMPLRKER